MRRRFPIIIPVLLGIGILAFLFLGSNMLGRDTQRPNQYGITQQGGNLLGDNMQGANPGTDNNLGMNRMGQKVQQQLGFDGQKAESIRKQLGGIDNIRDVNAIVNGNTALVSYRPTDLVKDASATRNMITDRVKQIDNSITNVIVSDREDISSRIDGLKDKIRNNRPANVVNSEFNQLLQSMRRGGL